MTVENEMGSSEHANETHSCYDIDRSIQSYVYSLMSGTIRQQCSYDANWLAPIIYCCRTVLDDNRNHGSVFCYTQA